MGSLWVLRILTTNLGEQARVFLRHDDALTLVTHILPGTETRQIPPLALQLLTVGRWRRKRRQAQRHPARRAPDHCHYDR